MEDRIEIQKGLDYGVNFKVIGQKVNKHETSISREVKKHLRILKTKAIRRDKDGTEIFQPCRKLLKAPFVCNACKRRRDDCGFDRHIYCAKTAQKEYERLLVEAREGIPLNNEQFYRNDTIITNGLAKGQHLYQIMQANDLGVCESTVYNHAKKGYFSFAQTELPRKVKFKKRKNTPRDYIAPNCKNGRTYKDFLAFKDENSLLHWVEMDTVIGRIGGKAILTLDFTFCNFMLGFLLDNLASATVTKTMKSIKHTLRENGLSFGQFFPVILTDNGGEFADIFAVENDLDGKPETKLFFCDPYKSSQKPHVEKNHTLFRDIVPKGSSFDSFTQETLNTIFSHVNNTARPSLMGKTPYQVFAYTFSKALPVVFDIDYVSPQNIIQTPLLLKQK